MGKYKVAVDMPNRPKGDPIEVPPVGVLKNGSSQVFELDDDIGKTLLDNAKGAAGIKVSKGGDSQ